MLRFVALSLGFSFAIFAALFVVFVLMGPLVDRLANRLCERSPPDGWCGMEAKYGGKPRIDAAPPLQSEAR